MAYPEDNEFDPEKLDYVENLSDEKVRQELTRRGATEIDFELMDMRANRVLEEMRVEGILQRFHRKFVHRVVFKSPRT